jgi:prepilin-type N-terminal cleavage/methylation domain-containing protein
MKLSARGFTLVELLVVISVMAVLTVIAIANFSNFKQDQALKGAAGYLQSQLRTTQTNASTGFKCNNKTANYWKSTLSETSFGSGKYQLQTLCSNADSDKNVISTVNLDNFQNVTLKAYLMKDGISCEVQLSSSITSSNGFLLSTPGNKKPPAVIFTQKDNTVYYEAEQSGFNTPLSVLGDPDASPGVQTKYVVNDNIFGCKQKPERFRIELKNTKTPTVLNLNVDKNGRIYVE